MVLVMVARMSLVVVSNVGRLTTAWYFAARFLKSARGSAAAAAGFVLVELHAVIKETATKKRIVFPCIISAGKLTAKRRQSKRFVIGTPNSDSARFTGHTAAVTA